MAYLPRSRHARSRILSACATLAALAISLVASPASAEFQIGVYGGVSESFDSDITLVQPNGTNLTLKSVPWDGASFDDPPYARPLLARRQAQLGTDDRL